MQNHSPVITNSVVGRLEGNPRSFGRGTKGMVGVFLRLRTACQLALIH